jgi:autotransporter-associated beta strand protein
MLKLNSNLLRLAGFSFLLAVVTSASALTLSNGVTTYPTLVSTTVTMSNRCELRVTATNAPLTGCTINLNSPDAWLLLPGIAPSVVVSTYLGQVFVNGAAAVADSNVRVVQYGAGSVVIAQAPAFQPLQAFSGAHFTGTASNFSQYVYYTGTGLGPLDANISSFRLKRGYMAVFAQNTSGNGISKCYIAADGDLDISLLPATLDNKVRFIYVTPWRWSTKKGIAGNIESGLNLGWKYNWNIDQNSTRDLEYVPIRAQRWWPGLGQNWQTLGANTVLGYNEPDSTSQANIAVGDAIWSWPDLLGTGLRVGSPAPTDGGRSSWLYPFITQADAAGLRVDFVAVHYYWCFTPGDPNGAATQMYNFLKATYDQVKRPLWITEWNNGANWTGCGDPTAAQQQAAIAAIITMLDNTPFVERYAIYNWVEDVRRVKWDDGSLTAAGVSYRDKASALAYQQTLPDHETRSVAQFLCETNTLDSSGFGNNALAVGAPAYTNGHSGQAVAFDGANTYLQLPPNAAATNSFTFAAWVYWNGGAQWQRLFDFGDDATHYLFLSPRSGGNTLRFAITSTGAEQQLNATQLPSNTWTHVAVTLTGGAAKLYTNGVLAASATGFTNSPATLTPANNFLGKSQFAADPLFAGRLDEIILADTAFSAAQISALLTNTPPQFNSNSLARPAALPTVVYSNSLAAEATDANAGDTLTFSKATGAAWLTVAANGVLGGTPAATDGGTNIFTVRVTDSAGASAFAQLTITTPVIFSSGTWSADASANWSDTNRWLGNAVANGASYTANFSTINISGNRTITVDTARTIGALKFGDISGAQSWTLTNAPGINLTLDTTNGQPTINVTNTTTLATPLVSTLGFLKSGPGTLILSGNNSLAGTLKIDSASASANDGIVRAANPGALGAVTNLQILNNTTGNSTLQLDGTLGGITVAADVAVAGRNLNLAALQNLTGTNTINGNLTLNVGGANYLLQSDAGLLTFRGGLSSVATGARALTFQGAGDLTVSGTISNGAATTLNLLKSGSGTLTLAGTNDTYTGTLTNNAGRLLVNGVVSNLVITAGTLGGSGRIINPVTLPAFANLAPGDSVGQLTFASSLTLAAGSITRLEVNQDKATNDVVKVLGAFTAAGTVVVTNAGRPLTVGDSFRFIDAGSYAGSYSVLTLLSPGNGLAWRTNTFATDGVLAVVLGTVAPQFEQAMFDGTNLLTAGTGGAANYAFTILTATNLTTPDTNWNVLYTGVCDATGAFSFTNVVNPQAPQQFFRVLVP